MAPHSKRGASTDRLGGRKRTEEAGYHSPIILTRGASRELNRCWCILSRALARNMAGVVFWALFWNVLISRWERTWSDFMACAECCSLIHCTPLVARWPLIFSSGSYLFFSFASPRTYSQIFSILSIYRCFIISCSQRCSFHLIFSCCCPPNISNLLFIFQSLLSSKTIVEQFLRFHPNLLQNPKTPKSRTLPKISQDAFGTVPVRQTNKAIRSAPSASNTSNHSLGYEQRTSPLQESSK